MHASCRRSVLQSISELGSEYADLVLVHWPHAWKKGTQEDDASVTLQDTWWVECLSFPLWDHLVCLLLALRALG